MLASVQPGYRSADLKRAREHEFHALTAEEAARVETLYAEFFGEGAQPARDLWLRPGTLSLAPVG